MNAEPADLLHRARALAERPGRTILGITGAPGAGKSTLATALVASLGSSAVLVPMDGFHLADDELRRLGRYQRKGAVDTFDTEGYVSLLTRIRACTTVYAPEFRRDLEAGIVGAILVRADVPLVVTEGNYLLTAEGGWQQVRPLLDEVWYVDPGEKVRTDRLVARHEAYGRDPATASARTHGSDQRNAELVASTRRLADLIVAY